uniref:Uncharacterized protein n=1 Tax=Arundo donax TaxID=35708 RepID=A0A0A9BC87_ARUDO
MNLTSREKSNLSMSRSQFCSSCCQCQDQ